METIYEFSVDDDNDIDFEIVEGGLKSGTSREEKEN